MTANGKNGLSLIILGIAMFVFGASIFSYQGNHLNPIINKAGMYSFFLWLPTIIIGIVMLAKKVTGSRPTF